MRPFSEELLEFFKKHEKTDVRQLALQRFEFAEFNRQEILQQLRGRQIALKKFPFLHQHPQFKFPVRISLEQASSEQTAQFKASIISGKQFADLTGGMGMDTFFIGQSFQEVHYVEPNEELTNLAAWNFELLGLDQVQIHQCLAEQFLKSNESKLDWIFIDPSRRTGNSRVIALENYQPDIIELWSAIRKTANGILVKFSPMQDLMEIKQKLAGLKKLWVLSVKNELKEIIAQFGQEQPDVINLEIVNITDRGTEKIWSGNLSAQNPQPYLSLPEQYLYEPAPGILKAGVQDQLAEEFKLKKLHRNSNLFTSNEIKSKYPGRIFKYKGVEKLRKKLLNKWVAENKAHVIVRNFPLGAEAIKKKLSLKESGKIYLLATTLMDEKKVILISERLEMPSQ